MHINWLHLTDLHRGMDLDHLWPNVREALQQDLKYLHPHCGPWDLILFTGDLTNRGTPEQFRQFDGLMARLQQEIAALQGDRQPVLLAVPGNHDLVRPPSGDEGLGYLAAWAHNQSTRETFWANPRSAVRKTVDDAFKHYTDWWQAQPACTGQATGIVDLRRGALPGDFAATFEKEGCRLGILGLNSSFLQLGGGDYREKLALDLRQADACCGGDVPDWVDIHHACLLLTHQPPSWLDSSSRQQLDGEIANGGRFAAHLCGHLHEAHRLVSAADGNQPRLLVQGRSLFGLETYCQGSAEKTRLHGYTAGRITFCGDPAGSQGELTLWPRSGERSGAETHIDRDPHQGLPKGQDATAPHWFKLAKPCASTSPWHPGVTVLPSPAVEPRPAGPQGRAIPGLAAALSPLRHQMNSAPSDGPPQPQVYVSYAWQPASQAIVAQLEAACAARGIRLVREQTRLSYGASIRAYMQEIGAAAAVVVVLSKDYLTSRNCMFELLEINRNQHLRERVQPIVVADPDGFDFFDVVHRSQCLPFWEQRASEIEATLAAMQQKDHLDALNQELNLSRDIRRLFDAVTSLLADMNTPAGTVHLDTGFDALIDRLHRLLAPVVLAPPPAPDATNATWQPTPELANLLGKELDKPAVAPLRRRLAERLSVASAARLAQTLCVERPPKEALMLFHGAVAQCKTDVAADHWRGDLQQGCRRVFGWLLGRFVQAGRPLDPFALEITVGNEAGAEVLWLRWYGGTEPPDLCIVDGQPRGTHNVRGGAGASEAGWSWQAYVHETKSMLWRKFLPDEDVPPTFGPTEDADLLEQMDFYRGHPGDHLYATVQRAETRDPWDDPAVLAALREGLRLPILFIDEAPDAARFTVSDRALQGYIRQCLATIG